MLPEANPLDAGGNTRGIVLIVVNGRFFARDELDALLSRLSESGAPPNPEPGLAAEGHRFHHIVMVEVTGPTSRLPAIPSR